METIEYSNKYNKVLAKAREISLKYNNNFIGTPHLLYSIFLSEDTAAFKILNKIGLDTKNIALSIQEKLDDNKNIDTSINLPLTLNAERAIKGSILEADLNNNKYINSAHLLLGLLHKQIFKSAQYLKYYKISYSLLRKEFNKIVEEPINHFVPPNNNLFINKLYKYLPNDIGVIQSIIENERIRYTQKEALNDIFDLQIRIDELFGLERFTGQVDYYSDSFYDEAFKNIPNSVIKQFGGKDKVKNMMQPLIPIVKKFLDTNIGSIESDFTKEIMPAIEDGFHKSIGILCLTEDVNNNLMWAHYSNMNKGFALQLNVQQKYFYDDQNGLPISPVEYTEVPYKIDNLLDSVKSDPHLAFSMMTFNKSIDWEYEREWRMIRPLQQAEDTSITDVNGFTVYLHHIPRDCIDGIVFGHNSNEKDKQLMIEKKKNDDRYDNIELYQSMIDKDNRQMKINKIEL